MSQPHLLQVLAARVPLPGRSVRLVERALALAGRPALPADAELLRAFVAGELQTVLADELGPRLAAELVRDLARDLDEILASDALRSRDTTPAAPSSKRVRPPPSSAPSNQPRVVLLGSDRVRDTAVTRALIRAGFDVVTPRDAVELGDALEGDALAAIVADEANATTVPAAVRDRVESETVLVAYGCSDAPRAESTLRALGARRVCALAAGCNTADLVTTVLALTAD